MQSSRTECALGQLTQPHCAVLDAALPEDSCRASLPNPADTEAHSVLASEVAVRYCMLLDRICEVCFS